jgi:repressor LexA
MFPLFQAGDTVIVRRQPDAESGEIAVVLVNGNDATVKKIIKKDTSILLVSENSVYEPMVFGYGEFYNLPVTVFGRVIELRRRF